MLRIETDVALKKCLKCYDGTLLLEEEIERTVIMNTGLDSFDEHFL